MDATASAIEQALRAIMPVASPSQLMDAVVQHAVATSKSASHRRRRATRRHGAYVRLRELEQSRQYNLQLDLIELKQQIAQLMQLRAMLDARTLNTPDAHDGSFVRTASVYYEVVAQSLSSVVVAQPDHNHIHCAVGIDIRAYFAAVMSDDVRLGRFAGRQLMVPMLNRYNSYFSGNHITLTSAYVLASHDQQAHDDVEVVVRTNASYGAWLTPHTLQLLFPHIVDHDTLVQQLLAEPLAGESTFDFVFDRASGRVVRFDCEMNFFHAFMRLVPDPVELAFLLSEAKISEEMFVGELDEYYQYAVSPPSAPSSPRVAILRDVDVASSGSASPVSGASDATRCEVATSKLSPSRSLKMTDLLAPELDGVESSREPSVSYA